MIVEVLRLAVLFTITIYYAEFISMLVEPISILVTLLAGFGYGLNYYHARSVRYGSKTIFEKRLTVFPWVAYITSWLRWLGTYFMFLLTLLLIKSFVFDTARVVSGSLKPTVLINDTILINKYRYGLRLPVTRTLLVKTSLPKRGDIVSFQSPTRSITMVKRMIGVPGDHIQYKQKQLTINGKPIHQSILGVVQDVEKTGSIKNMLESEEDLLGRKYKVYTTLDEPGRIIEDIFIPLQYDNEFSVIVPKDQYFVMGDNRDNSLDSRHWGFVPGHCLLGEVRCVIFSWDKMASWDRPFSWVRWHRIGVRFT